MPIEIVPEPTPVRRAVASAWPSPLDLPELDRPAASKFREDLLAGQFRLIEQFEEAGRQYFVWERGATGWERVRSLTDREREVLQHVAAGENDRAISMELRCSPSTVATHRLRAMAKLGIDSRTLLAQILAGVSGV